MSRNTQAVGPSAPLVLVRKLESSTIGAHWMREALGRPAAQLEPGTFWQSQNHFQAIRLLGQNPIDALDDRRIAEIIVASDALDPIRGNAVDDLGPSSHSRDSKTVIARWPGLVNLAKSPAECRQLLIELVDQNIAPWTRSSRCSSRTPMSTPSAWLSAVASIPAPKANDCATTNSIAPTRSTSTSTSTANTKAEKRSGLAAGPGSTTNEGHSCTAPSDRGPRIPGAGGRCFGCDGFADSSSGRRPLPSDDLSPLSALPPQELARFQAKLRHRDSRPRPRRNPGRFLFRCWPAASLGPGGAGRLPRIGFRWLQRPWRDGMGRQQHDFTDRTTPAAAWPRSAGSLRNVWIPARRTSRAGLKRHEGNPRD